MIKVGCWMDKNERRILERKKKVLGTMFSDQCCSTLAGAGCCCCCCMVAWLGFDKAMLMLMSIIDFYAFFELYFSFFTLNIVLPR